jgi:competence protein ComEC
MYTENLSIKPPPIIWSPLASMGLTASFGSCVGSTLSTEIDLVVPLSLAITICGIAVALQRNTLFICLLIGLFAIFYGRARAHNEHTKTPWVYILDGDLVILSCRVNGDSVAKQSTEGTMYSFDYREQYTVIQTTALPLKNPSAAKASVTIVCNGEIDASLGDTLHCAGWLRGPTARFSKTTLFVPSKNAIQIIKKNTTGQTKQTKIKNQLLRGVSPKNKTLAKALFFGERGSGWESLSEVFRRSGMSHVLAMSGMHVAILLLFCSTILSICRVKKTYATIIIITLAVSLFWLVEPRPSVVRAILTISILLFVQFLYIQSTVISIVGASAIVILVNYPTSGSFLGFQLSFLVVSMFCVLLPRIVWRLLGPVDVNALSRNMARRWVCNLWIAGVCAWIVSAPIILYMFGTFAPVTILSNIPSTIMLVSTLWCGMAKTLLSLFSETIGYPPQLAFDQLLTVFLQVSESLKSTPFGFYSGLYFPWYCAMATLAGFVVWAVKIRKRPKTITVTIIGVCVLLYFSTLPPLITKITTIDVGHGTCHLIQHGEYTMMIDAGSRNNFDIGKEKITPIIRSLGITTIDVLVITHSDIDHVVGIIDVIKTVPVTKIIIAPPTLGNQTPPLQKVLTELHKYNTGVSVRSKWWKKNVGELSITILSPEAQEEHRSSNAVSIVLLLEIHNRKIIFTGDIDETQITKLMKTIPTDTDVIELPHHGQWSPESQKLITSIQPVAVIQSTNKSRHSRDRWIIPYKTTRYVTAVDGTITTTISSNGTIKIIGELDPASMPPCISRR